jgi:hypothetical protein
MSFTERQVLRRFAVAPFAVDLGDKGKSGPISMPNTQRRSERSRPCGTPSVESVSEAPSLLCMIEALKSRNDGSIGVSGPFQIARNCSSVGLFPIGRPDLS